MKKYFLFVIFTFLIYSGSSVLALTQSPCSGSVSITDTSQGQSAIMIVLSNSAQATFTVTGPTTYQGSGFVWSQQNIPAGTYTVTWSPVAGCGTPSPETKTTDSGGSVAFAGNYKDISTPAPSSKGTIDIRTNLTQSPNRKNITFTITGPQNRTIDASNSTWYYAPEGTYTITYSGEIEGYDAPAPQIKTLPPDGSIVFEVNYTLSQTLPLTVVSYPTGATVYIDGVLIGKPPAIKKVSRGATHKIRCTIPGYNDYVHDYTVAPFNSVSNSVKGDWTCLLTVKKEGVAPTPFPSNSQSLPEQIPTNTRQFMPQEENVLPPTPPTVLPQQKPQGFFSRVVNSISSFLRNLFGGKNS